jgi:hypothetical protein
MGTPINDTVIDADASILKPVQDGAAADCHSAGVKFVRVQLELDYSDLAVRRVDAGPAPILRGEYYIQLPQGTIDLVNAPGNARRLTTFLGANDLRALSADEVRNTILNSTHQDGPYDLLAPSFNLSSCCTDSQTVYGESHWWFAWPQTQFTIPSSRCSFQDTLSNPTTSTTISGSATSTPTIRR